MLRSVDEVLAELERLGSLIDHEPHEVGQVLGVPVLVPRLVDNLVVGVNLNDHGCFK